MAAEQMDAEARRAREAEEKAERERDLAIAHDRQPYPTAAAYEAVCAAREKYAKSADAAIAERDRLAAIIAEAPHAETCHKAEPCTLPLAPGGVCACDCWKQAALANAEKSGK